MWYSITDATCNDESGDLVALRLTYDTQRSFRLMPPEPEQVPRPPVLEYAKPGEPVSFRRVIAGVVGVAFGLVAIPLLFMVGHSFLDDLERDPALSSHPGDVIGGDIFALCIVVVLALVSWGWICYSFRIGAWRVRKVL